MYHWAAHSWGERPVEITPYYKTAPWLVSWPITAEKVTGQVQGWKATLDRVSGKGSLRRWPLSWVGLGLGEAEEHGI